MGKYAREMNFLSEEAISFIAEQLGGLAKLGDLIEAELPFENSNVVYRAEFMLVDYTAGNFRHSLKMKMAYLFFSHILWISPI